MTRHETPHHDAIRSSRFLTGVVLLAGCTLLGLGIGLATSQPGFGLIIGAGAWLVALSLIRVARGL